MGNCPHCSVPLELIHTRKNFPVPDFDTQENRSILIRFPLLQCPICKEKFGNEDTRRIISQAVEEYFQREADKQARRSREQLDSFERSLRRFWLCYGFITAAMFVAGMYEIARHNISLGAYWVATGVLLFFNGFIGYEWFVKHKRKKQLD